MPYHVSIDSYSYCQMIEDGERGKNTSSIGQRILVNQGVHNVLVDILKMDADGRNGVSY